ncbi:hypothetical protein [Yinghuangia sp. YIM S10712]|uniref:hypothetical protein n=1 Tax=Yinghuangia sp. YIM S10712 TaxID=3436930 RepID=UPI003F536A94
MDRQPAAAVPLAVPAPRGRVVPLTAAPATYAAAVDRYRAASGITPSSARVYRISLPPPAAAATDDDKPPAEDAISHWSTRGRLDWFVAPLNVGGRELGRVA